ncbi:protein phosphatase 2C domain-containing protein [Streptomyces caniferus]
MNQQGAARGHEDDWWRELYGDGSRDEGAGEGAPAPGAVVDAGPSDTPDTLDERVESALRALRAPRRAGPAPQKPPDSGTAEPPPRKPPARPTPAPPEPSPPIPLRSTGPDTQATSGDRPSTGRPTTGRPPADVPSDGRRAADRPPTDRPSGGRPSADRRSADGRSPGADRGAADRPAPTDRPSADPPPTPRPSPADRSADRLPPNNHPPANQRATPAPPAPRDTPPRATAGPVADRVSDPGAEPGELPVADPAVFDDPVPDTTLDGAHYGALTLRAASQRGAAARRRGDVRRDALLTARFGAGRHALILVAVATGLPSAEGGHRAARDACTWIGGAVGRSYTRLAEDIRTERRGALKSGLQRLTDRSYGKLRGLAQERGAPPERYPAALRCLLVPADPECRTRVFFGVGAGGLFLLRDGAWQDLEPAATGHTVREAAGGTGGLPRPAPDVPQDPYPAESPVPPEPFLFRTAFARPGDTLLLCSAGLAEPLRDEPDVAARLADRWSAPEPPGLVDFLAAAQLRAEGHPKDRTAVGVWES